MKGKRFAAIMGAALALFICLGSSVLDAENLDKYFEDEQMQPAETETAVQDPLEPINRFFFAFNDKLYFWAIKPVSTVYAKVVLTDLRIAIRNAFRNLLAPVRIVNNFLQGKVQDSGTELVRFAVNSTFGIGGLVDVGKDGFHLEEKDEDFGQTFGFYGAGDGIYFCWPFLGPSNLRDTIGLVGDGFLSPINYLAGGNFYSTLGLKAGERVNDVSLRLGDYERFKEAAIDPYLSMRQAYTQYRKKKINDSVPLDQDKEQDATAPFSSLGPGQRRTDGNSTTAVLMEGKAEGLATARYAVHLALATDEVSARELLEKLVDDGNPATLVEYQRGDYAFFGVEVPIAGNFAVAKSEELRYVKQGYQSAMVIDKKM